MSVFSERIKVLRLERKEKQSDVAEVLGVSVQSYSAYESSREPNYDLLCKLAKHFGTTTDYLLGMEDAIKRENVNIVKVTGLTGKAVDTLKGCLSRGKTNSITLAVNALLEDKSILKSIGRYLYYNINENDDNSVITFNEIYKYQFADSQSHWGDDDNTKPPIDCDVRTEIFTNEKYKKLGLIEVLEELQKLFEKENE